ncbi:MAG: GNAT family N-acetyltransferase [Alphaproteobacteria bacterium]|nr:GNAT family N-acetyltransferase [Alphaproteobacteria bacterium]
MKCRFHWNTLSLADWHKKFATIRRSTLTQSYEYGLTMRRLKQQMPRFGLIEIEGAEAGLVQIQEIRILGGLIHVMTLDRGPLWFDGYGSADHLHAFAHEFRREFPRRPGRMLRFIPEGGTAEIFTQAGFRRRNVPGYQTIWLDVTRDEDKLRANLDKKWRNALAKAERSNLAIECDDTGKFLPWLLKTYQIDKAVRGYDGASPALITALCKNGGRCLVGKAVSGGQDIAAILLLLHGSSATYQIGWTSEEGRKRKTHNLLLWNAMLKLKERGITDFDLGGINEETPGLTTFKKGMGGDMVSLPGVFY